ncbi:MAG: precorrin-6y C5,15-methyltransferase (decarboxylating) subunit CbiE [Eubacterium sp.]|nr:precorrin-6y C5,15-methyltransferase (decarboxylating) subunit CbiE [Eubacterium sp.]
MYPLSVVGLGPGHPDYILPAAKKAIEAAEVILCGERHLESFDTEGKELLIIGNGVPLSMLVQQVKAVYLNTRTAVVVSGDTGFYSLLSYLEKMIPRENMRVIPGISSLQYMFAMMGMSWQDAAFMSLHGRDQDIMSRVAVSKAVGILTDQEHNTAYIASVLKDNGCTDKWIYVGEDLSYENEGITRLSVEEALTFQEEGMAVVVIADE